MKYVAYRLDGRDLLGAVSADEKMLVPLREQAAAPGTTLLRLIEGGAHELADSGTAVRIDDPDLKLLPPIPSTGRNVFCVGKNYRAHVEELDRTDFVPPRDEQFPDAPIYFTKLSASAVTHGGAVLAHSGVTDSVDYEAEIGVIISAGGRGIAAEDAWDHVWGFTLVNDVTARDLQRGRGQWFLGKSLDTFCAVGPWAVSIDEVDVPNVVLESWVNGEPRQKGHLSDLVFDVPTLIADLSSGITLQTGDIIATGTPSGVGLGFDPPRFLRPGDVVRVAATGLGVLENHVVA
ncbi:MAG TPA: fumarylacetoacetate hydrolase family protein [Nocardioidaceae bacterium]|nr:fumarylacetoacetate hydrolase family protein [Nocardioidaceae bacterium]